MGITEKNMETTIVYCGYIRMTLNPSYYCISGLYRDNGKENGSYYLGFRVLECQFERLGTTCAE